MVGGDPLIRYQGKYIYDEAQIEGVIYDNDTKGFASQKDAFKIQCEL